MSVMIAVVFLFTVWLSLLFSSRAAEAGRDIIVVAGNFSIDGKIMNVAQYDISTGQ